MHILYFTRISTFPVIGGEKIRSYGLLKILSDLNYKVTAVIGKSYGIIPIRNVGFIEFDFDNIKSSNKYVGYYKMFRKNTKIINLFDEILANNNIDIAFLDYYFNGQYINYFKEKNIKVIYGTHNAEAKLNLQRPVYSYRNIFSYRIQYFAEWLHERVYFPRADALISVSEQDYLYYCRFINKNKVFIIPNMLDENIYKLPDIKKGKYIIMSANFQAFQNFVGLEWFIRNIWDEELMRQYQLLLVGIGSIEILEKLKEKYNNLNSIKAIGEVEDVKPYISKAKVSIVPLLNGSGTRLKCIESMALKTQLISTSKGAEGMIHDGSIIIADTPELFRNKLIDVLNNKIDNTEKAYKIFMNIYSLPPNSTIFKKVVNYITN
jgi:hypothetical protein